MQKATQQEHNNNWKGASHFCRSLLHTYEEENDKDVPRNANVISSHTLFKFKDLEYECLEMKARFVFQGNPNSEKDEIRKDSSSPDMTIFRLVFSLVVILGITFGRYQRFVHAEPPC